VGRPKGSKNREGTKKVGRKPRQPLMAKATPEEVLFYKSQILDVLARGEYMTLADAARKFGIEPIRVHWWARDDKDFQEMVKLAREVAADDLERELAQHANFIPKMMILKGYRPMFRDNFKGIVISDKLENLLVELNKLKDPPQEENK